MAVAHRTCPFCEATCGLEITHSEGRVTKVRGDGEDVFSKGFLCPKGVSIKELHEDPDRLRTPMIRQADGTFREASWDEAFGLIAERLPAVLEAGGRDACAVYLGNPSAHTLSTVLYGRPLIKAIGTKNVYSASTVDQYPKQMASALMFGTRYERADPGHRPHGLPAHAGRQPAGLQRLADDRPGRARPAARDPRARREDRGGRPAPHADGQGGRRAPLHPPRHRRAAAVRARQRDLRRRAPRRRSTISPAWTRCASWRATSRPRRSPPATGIDAERDPRGSRASSPARRRAAVYGRIGTTTQAFGTTASWLVDVLNAITGNLDRPGGAMFTARGGGRFQHARRGRPRARRRRSAAGASRVRGLGEILGELPVATLADEIETPGEGQVRALITIAGNPVVSTPNAGRLDAALASLDFMVSVDIYVNETTRHADVILPAPSPLEKPHYDLALYMFAIRNVANFSPALMDPPAGMLDEWETLLALTAIVAGQGPDADIAALDDMVAAEARAAATDVEPGCRRCAGPSGCST